MTGWILVDTDLVIDFLRDKGPGAALVPRWLEEDRLRLSVITLMELRSGYDWFDRGISIDPLFIGGPVVFDRSAALEAGQIESGLRARGTPVGRSDVQQAGICLARNLPLATRNLKHFSRIERLTLVDVEHE